jgi:hydroxyacylglutathione hydrolase
MKVITIPCSFDNYAYLIICEETGEAAVVDPSEFYPVYLELEKQKARLAAVYCTHHHADHVGGLEELVEEFDGLTVCGSEKDAGRIPGMNCVLTERSRISIGKIAGRMLSTPGHTKGSVCYLFNDSLFTGDTLFGGGCGRIFEGTPEGMYNSLNIKLKKLPGETKVYFGHEYTFQNLTFAEFVEPDNMAIKERLEEVGRKQGISPVTSPSTLQLESATNPFLRCKEEGVSKTVSDKCGVDRLDVLSVFSALREMKDNF